jgi:hypothetical protein
MEVTVEFTKFKLTAFGNFPGKQKEYAYVEKPFKKTLELGKYMVGWLVSQIHKKTIVSVGTNSTFRHPLGV